MKHFTIGRMGLALLGTAVVCLSQAAVASAGGGNSDVAKLCQKGGWQTLVRADGSPFASQDECVSYGAQGGTPRHPTQALADCQSFSGTFAFGTGSTLWSCNDWAASNLIEYSLGVAALGNDCLVDGGQPSVVVNTPVATITCSTGT
jgi:hypothetical protein